jgi:hypothetical protein
VESFLSTLLILGFILVEIHRRRALAHRISSMAGCSKAGNRALIILASVSGLVILAGLLRIIPYQQSYAGALCIGVLEMGVYFTRIAASVLTTRGS